MTLSAHEKLALKQTAQTIREACQSIHINLEDPYVVFGPFPIDIPSFGTLTGDEILCQDCAKTLNLEARAEGYDTLIKKKDPHHSLGGHCHNCGQDLVFHPTQQWMIETLFLFEETGQIETDPRTLLLAQTLLDVIEGHNDDSPQMLSLTKLSLEWATAVLKGQTP